MASTESLHSWGANSYGQLCCGHKEDTIIPQTIEEKSTRTEDQYNQVKYLTGGGGHSVILTEDGHLFTCGWNNKGQLGHSHCDDITIPKKVHSLPAVQHVACGWNHTIALSVSGDVFVWGSCAFGQLGLGNNSGAIKKPVHLNIFPCPVISVAAGLRHSLAVTADGSVWSWGSNKRGQLGYDIKSTIITSPTQVKMGLTEVQFSKVAAGSHHSAALSCSGVVYVWGCNQHGQCGLNCEDQQRFFNQPQSIKGNLHGVKIIDIQSGWSHLIVISDDRRVFTWGRSDYGQLGQGEEAVKCKYDPEPKEICSLKGVKQVCCGSEHCAVLSATDDILTWGWNEHGMCGTGDEINVMTPGAVPKLQGCNILLVGCGNGCTFAISCCDKK